MENREQFHSLPAEAQEQNELELRPMPAEQESDQGLIRAKEKMEKESTADETDFLDTPREAGIAEYLNHKKTK